MRKGAPNRATTSSSPRRFRLSGEDKAHRRRMDYTFLEIQFSVLFPLLGAQGAMKDTQPQR